MSSGGAVSTSVIIVPNTTAMDAYFASLRNSTHTASVAVSPSITGSPATFGRPGAVAPNSTAAAAGFGGAPGAGSNVTGAAAQQSAQVLMQAAQALQASAPALNAAAQAMRTAAVAMTQARQQGGAGGSATVANAAAAAVEEEDEEASVDGDGRTRNRTDTVGGRNGFSRRGGAFGRLRNFNRFHRLLTGGAILFEGIRLADHALESAADERAMVRAGGEYGVARLGWIEHDQNRRKEIYSDLSVLGTAAKWLGNAGLTHLIGGKSDEDLRILVENIKNKRSGNENRDSIEVQDYRSQGQAAATYRSIRALQIRPGLNREFQSLRDTQTKLKEDQYIEELDAWQELQRLEDHDSGGTAQEINNARKRLDGMRIRHQRALNANQASIDAHTAETQRVAEEHTDTIMFHQGSSNKALSRQMEYGHGGPQASAALAHQGQIEDQSLIGARDAYIDASIPESQRADVADQRLRGGVLQEQQMVQHMLRNLKPEELDSINQQNVSGEGTTDFSEVISNANKLIQEMNDQMKANGGNLETIIAILRALKAF